MVQLRSHFRPLAPALLAPVAASDTSPASAGKTAVVITEMSGGSGGRSLGLG